MKVKIVRPSKEICVFASFSRFCPLFCLWLMGFLHHSTGRKLSKFNFFSTYYKRKFKESLSIIIYTKEIKTRITWIQCGTTKRNLDPLQILPCFSVYAWWGFASLKVSKKQMQISYDLLFFSCLTWWSLVQYLWVLFSHFCCNSRL